MVFAPSGFLRYLGEGGRESEKDGERGMGESKRGRKFNQSRC
jgi:hypothetical protein